MYVKKGKGICLEFKSRSTIGLKSTSLTNYLLLASFIPWTDFSGGYPVRLAISMEGLWYQSGVNGTTWSKWIKIRGDNDVRQGNINIGKLAGNSGGSKVITFDAPMPNNSYSVNLTRASVPGYWSSIEFAYTNKTTTGFSLCYWNNSGASTDGDMIVDWMAVHS